MEENCNKLSHNRRLSAKFDDGIRSVDFMLAYRNNNRHAFHSRYRSLFEAELEKLGLELEYEPSDNGETSNQTRFVKIHATWDTLTRQAEFLRLQMPIMENDLPVKYKVFKLISCLSVLVPLLMMTGHEFHLIVFVTTNLAYYRSSSWTSQLLIKIFKRNPFALQAEFMLPNPDVFTDAFDRRRESQFLMDGENRDKFFSQAQKIAITWDIISGVALAVPIEKKTARKFKYSISKSKKNKVHDSPTICEIEPNGFDKQNTVKTVDIEYLLKEEIYTAAFPVHDGDCSDTIDDDLPPEQWPLRQYLYKSWVSSGQWYRHQPLNEIRNYFGEKVAMYFAWLGFYTKMLILPAIVGLISFLCGIFSLINNPIVDDFCSKSSNVSSRTVCRLCPDTVCDYETVVQNCGMAKLYTIFDNESTVFFSLFMAIWAILFLEFWKRRQSELCAQWDVSDAEFNEGKVRIEYQLKVSATKLNPITNKMEPFLPFSSKFRRLMVSILAVIFFILVVVGLLAAVMVYKTLGPIVWRQILYDYQEHHAIMSPQLVSSITASVVNGIFIAIMTKVYFTAAWALTTSEYPRTETEFENSYTYKVFIFQFVNFYGALFYLSFVRGQFVSAPHQQGSREARCPITGCLLDVSIQLAIVMVGKQALNNILEIGLPKLRNWWRRRKLNTKTQHSQWELDYELDPVPPLHLTDDYLEMLIQYGFVTMFVAAFPLAPLFALLNNIIEIRLDARKHLCETRRCIPIRAKDLGPWFLLLSNVTKIAILTNGLLIALTTDFIDRILYVLIYSKDRSMNGYVENIFSDFDPHDWNFETNNASDFCIYRDYRNPPDSFEKYQRTSNWWLVLTAKLLFIFVFEHTVIMLQTLIAFIIPDVPDHVVERQQREQHIQREKFMQEEHMATTAKATVNMVEETEILLDDQTEKKSDVLSLEIDNKKETPKSFFSKLFG